MTDRERLERLAGNSPLRAIQTALETIFERSEQIATRWEAGADLAELGALRLEYEHACAVIERCADRAATRSLARSLRLTSQAWRRVHDELGEELGAPEGFRRVHEELLGPSAQPRKVGKSSGLPSPATHSALRGRG
jgi:hypothetical protein